MKDAQPELFENSISDVKSTNATPDVEKSIVLINQNHELDELKRPSWSVEANFMVLPIFSFDKKQVEKSGRVIHSVPIVQNGTVFTSKLVISATGVEKDGKFTKESLPGAFDMQILFCLMDMWDEQGRPADGKVLFRLNTVCNRLKLNDSGRSFEQIKNSIYKLKWTAIESTKAFYSADKSAHVSVPITMIDDYAISTHRGKTNSQDSCMVVLGKNILDNLALNYTAKINRKIYQQLDVGFAQRILCLVLFKQQIENETGVIDFELTDLAKLIPISGKLYPSTIMVRLEKALEELDEKKVFKHEYVRLGKSHILRLFPYEQPEKFLLGSGNIARFEQMVVKVYGGTVAELIGYTVEALQRKLDKDTGVIEYSGRKYSHVFHCADILLCMLKNGYKAQNPVSVLNTLLKAPSEKLDIPDNYVPIDIQYKALLAKEQLTKVVQESYEKKDEADEACFRAASGYVDLLTVVAYERYKKQAIENKPMAADSKFILRGELIELIYKDMKAGKPIDLIKGVDSSKTLSGNA